MPKPPTINLAKLTPREREIFTALYGPGSTETLEDVAERLGLYVSVVRMMVAKCRGKLGPRFVASPRRREHLSAARKVRPDATKPTGKTGRFAHLDHDPNETRVEARERVAREIATGTRCGGCWLLLPCACAVERAA